MDPSTDRAAARGGSTLTTEKPARLQRLNDIALTVADPSEDVRGRKVLDAAGEEIGEVDDLLIDDRENKVRFLQVASGGFLGIGETTFLIPVDAVTRLTDEHVHVNQTREKVAGAPRYDPAMIEEPDWGGYYGYYGFTPFWGMGYVYPHYPYY